MSGHTYQFFRPENISPQLERRGEEGHEIQQGECSGPSPECGVDEQGLHLQVPGQRSLTLYQDHPGYPKAHRGCKKARQWWGRPWSSIHYQGKVTMFFQRVSIAQELTSTMTACTGSYFFGVSSKSTQLHATFV